jgi:hypothetical protein
VLTHFEHADNKSKSTQISFNVLNHFTKKNAGVTFYGVNYVTPKHELGVESHYFKKAASGL